jgi:hypothetical protein
VRGSRQRDCPHCWSEEPLKMPGAWETVRLSKHGKYVVASIESAHKQTKIRNVVAESVRAKSIRASMIQQAAQISAVAEKISGPGDSTAL